MRRWNCRVGDALPLAGRMLLACCAAPDGDHSAHLHSLTAQQWDGLLALARRTRTLPLLAHAARGAQLPAGIAADLHQEMRHAALATLAQGRAIARVVTVLQGAGFQPLALKGLALAYRDYPDPALRPLRDVDLLLPADQAEAAQALLLGQPGFATLPGAGRYGLEYGHQLPEIVDQHSGLVIELHHRLNARGWPGEGQLLGMMQGAAITANMLGVEVQVPGPHANFLHLVEHATWHHLFGNGPLILADLHYLSQRNGALDWPKLRVEAAQMGLERALILVANMAQRAGASWVPDGWIDDAIPQDVTQAGFAALLDDEAAVRQHAMLNRLAQRSGASGPVAALGRVLRPDPYQLARLSGRTHTDALRWMAYPRWLCEKGGNYLLAATSGRARAASTAKAQLRGWIEQG